MASLYEHLHSYVSFYIEYSSYIGKMLLESALKWNIFYTNHCNHVMGIKEPSSQPHNDSSLELQHGSIGQVVCENIHAWLIFHPCNLQQIHICSWDLLLFQYATNE